MAGGWLRSVGAGVRCIASQRRHMSNSKRPVTPDFTTPVNVADVKIQKPRRARSGAWEGLEGLESRTRGSLVDDTLKAMAAERAEAGDHQPTTPPTTTRLLRQMGAEAMSLKERKLRQRTLQDLGVPSFYAALVENGVENQLVRADPEILQLNVGLYCNQACNHCHVESSPERTETMSLATATKCLKLLLGSEKTHTLDLTGGAPELNAVFRPLVSGARAEGFTGDIIDRCNLTVLSEPGQEDLVHFLAENRVHVVASLPCYSSKNVNMQRGRGVFDKSIAGLRQLNAVGYGEPSSDLRLDLVYNPIGPFLAPDQQQLEVKYKEELEREFGIIFNSLFTITNMPIKRFADFLYRRGELAEYMDLLVRNFNPGAVAGLMCRNTISVSWDGNVYDCDFNQQLLIRSGSYSSCGAPGREVNVHDLQHLDELAAVEIAVDAHCFGCTAGMGSSCQGATA